MTKKDFEFIAKTINVMPGGERLRSAVAFADALEKENPKFDPKRFLAACLSIEKVKL